jgi:hypothetical protein
MKKQKFYINIYMIKERKNKKIKTDKAQEASTMSYLQCVPKFLSYVLFLSSCGSTRKICSYLPELYPLV